MIDIIDDVAKNGTYIGSGEYVPRGNKVKDTIRLDYFETPITIDDKNYIAKFDIEVFSNANNYKKHNVVYNVKEIDLVSSSVADTGHSPAAAEKGLGLNNNISNPNAKVNNEYSDILSEDVAEHFGNTRKESKLKKSVKFQLKDDSIKPFEISKDDILNNMQTVAGMKYISNLDGKNFVASENEKILR